MMQNNLYLWLNDILYDRKKHIFVWNLVKTTALDRKKNIMSDTEQVYAMTFQQICNRYSLLENKRC